MNPNKIVVISGAGISAESGLQTFRDKGALWEKYDFMELATPEAWAVQPERVLEFYNLRRKLVRDAQPNPAHLALLRLEKKYQVHIITQNVDDLHERAGSSHIIHLHGEIMKARSSLDDNLMYDLEDKDIAMGDLCEKGSQLRPHVVWFGEAVPMMAEAIRIISDADIVIIIGTSMLVYPAAGLINYAPEHASIYLIDKKIPEFHASHRLITIEGKAGEAVPELINKLLENKK
jgi:NAD-dependent deacetylase